MKYMFASALLISAVAGPVLAASLSPLEDAGQIGFALPAPSPEKAEPQRLAPGTAPLLENDYLNLSGAPAPVAPPSWLGTPVSARPLGLSSARN